MNSALALYNKSVSEARIANEKRCIYIQSLVQDRDQLIELLQDFLFTILSCQVSVNTETETRQMENFVLCGKLSLSYTIVHKLIFLREKKKSPENSQVTDLLLFLKEQIDELEKVADENPYPQLEKALQRVSEIESELDACEHLYHLEQEAIYHLFMPMQDLWAIFEGDYSTINTKIPFVKSYIQSMTTCIKSKYEILGKVATLKQELTFYSLLTTRTDLLQSIECVKQTQDIPLRITLTPIAQTSQHAIWCLRERNEILRKLCEWIRAALSKICFGEYIGRKNEEEDSTFLHLEQEVKKGEQNFFLCGIGCVKGFIE